MNITEYCPDCRKVQPVRNERFCGYTATYCEVCGAWIDTIWDEEEETQPHGEE
jgi:hypothetical protein